MKVSSHEASWFVQVRCLLLHLKCLVWCLHQMKTRYDLNLVLYSLEHGSLHPGIRDSNLGDNVSFLLQHLDGQDVARIADAVAHLPESVAMVDVDDKHLEIGHYIQSTRDFGPIKASNYGIISAISPRPHGLFLLEGGTHLIEAPFEPDDVRTIFGTYVI
jgi:hypothetical protein